MMRPLHLLLVLTSFLLAASAQAAAKFYDASIENGTPSPNFNLSPLTCPPVVTVDPLKGIREISDDGLGTVTLENFTMTSGLLFDFGDQLVSILGPGAFFFLDNKSTVTFAGQRVSNTNGIGAHGPSGTDPGESAEWGLISGFLQTGRQFCLSSPPLVCNDNGFAHGATVSPAIPSTTYDLGTWSFDSVGDLQASPYIDRTSAGGTGNRTIFLTGAFHGSSLPALPLVGFGSLAIALFTIGGRAVWSRK